MEGGKWEMGQQSVVYSGEGTSGVIELTNNLSDCGTYVGETNRTPSTLLMRLRRRITLLSVAVQQPSPKITSVDPPDAAAPYYLFFRFTVLPSLSIEKQRCLLARQSEKISSVNNTSNTKE